MSSTFRIRVGLPKRGREEFFAWVWREFGRVGLMGVHEGTVLSEEAARQGLETESWTIDSGEAPRDRDWIGGQGAVEAELYFKSFKAASNAKVIIQGRPEAGLKVGEVEEQVAEDWDAKWKASFTGATVPPFWQIVPPWKSAKVADGVVALRLNPGAGFGTGTHETTQLCLRLLGELAVKPGGLRGKSCLDFGSGSGILAIGAALMGAGVDAVEIDPLAVDNARENAAMNGVDNKIRFREDLSPLSGPYDLVLANILKPVLIEFAPSLVQRLAPGGRVILSGLMEGDLPAVVQRYSKLLGNRAPERHELGEWRALEWC